MEQTASEPAVLDALHQGWDLAAQEADDGGKAIIMHWFTALSAGSLPGQPTKAILGSLWRNTLAAQRFGTAFIPEYSPRTEHAVRIEVMTAAPDVQPQWQSPSGPPAARSQPIAAVPPGTA